MPSLRTFAFLCGGSFAALLMIGWCGSILQASGTIRDAGALKIPFLALMIGLLLVFAFSAIPLMVGAVLGFQRNIGNQNLPVVRSALRSQHIIVYAMWGLIAAGLLIAVPAAMVSGAFTESSKLQEEETAPQSLSEGTLIAAPGMTFAEMSRRSTLKIDINMRAPITSAVGAGGVFDYHIPGTGMFFRNCRYYFVSPYTHARDRIESVNIGLSPHTISRLALEQADTSLRARLAADGWLTGHEEYRTEEDRSLHGGATRGPEGNLWLKNNLVLSLDSRRMDDAVSGEDSKTAGKWIQFIAIWQRSDYPYVERYVFAPPTAK
jgi:hypothetical protein